MESITRLEKKIDLLFRIILGLEVRGIQPYDEKYISNFMDEIIPLFELKMQEPPNPKEIEPIEQEIQKVQEILKSGNYLKKDEDKIKTQIKDLNGKMNEFNSNIQKYKNNYSKETWIKLYEKVGGKIESLSPNIKSRLHISIKSNKRH